MTTKEARNKIYLFLREKGFDLDPNRDELKKLIIEYGEVVNSQPTKIDFNIGKGKELSVEPVEKKVKENKFRAPKTYG